MTKIRNVISVVVGTTLAACIFFIGEQLNWLLHPQTEVLDYTDREAMHAYFNAQPISIWITSLFVWSLGSLSAGYVIKYICRSTNYSLPLIAGCILTLLGTKNMFTLPHPLWFSYTAFLAFIPFVLIGFTRCKVSVRKRKARSAIKRKQD